MSSQQPSMLISYRYDALNRLSSHRQLNIADCERFYCINNLITEIQGDEHISIVQHGALLLAHQKHHGDGLEIDMIVTDQQRSVLLRATNAVPTSRLLLALRSSECREWYEQLVGVHWPASGSGNRKLFAGKWIPGVQPSADAIQQPR